ncbi:MAG: glycyl-radical enzyme activating protein [Candidatus Zixiibacteriota bacterium]|nr:MAG: glycyl-radical enzyme activating protein [candidate division Zixibacteria bacterium]
MRDTGIVFDIKRYAIHDGPGIRTTVFLKGCLLDCPWCHNPEGKNEKPEFMWWAEKCIGCRDCQNACPQDAISFSDGSLLLDTPKCDFCGACTDVCPSEALKQVGQKMTVAQVLKVIEKDRAFYDQSGGGVSLSGGEPLLQPDFACALLGACKERGIHTAVDTCGHVDSDALMRIGEQVDLFLYDLKVIDDEKHESFTGVSNKLILENLKKLSDCGQRTIVRFPLVPGVNDDEKDIQEVGELLSSLGGVKEINVLPYHKGGVEKLERLRNSKNKFFTDQTPSVDVLNEVKSKLRAFGLRVELGG